MRGHNVCDLPLADMSTFAGKGTPKYAAVSQCPLITQSGHGKRRRVVVIDLKGTPGARDRCSSETLRARKSSAFDSLTEPCGERLQYFAASRRVTKRD